MNAIEPTDQHTPMMQPPLVHLLSSNLFPHYLQKFKALGQLEIWARLKINNLPNAKLKMRDDIFLTFLKYQMLEKNNHDSRVG